MTDIHSNKAKHPARGLAPPSKSTAGRPPKPEQERTVVTTVRLTPLRKDRLRELGSAWLAQKIDDEYAAHAGGPTTGA